MNPNPTQIAQIKAFVANLQGGWTANTGAQVRAAMASTQVANPVATRPTVGKRYEAADAMVLISAGTLAKIEPLHSFDTVIVPMMNQAAKSADDVKHLNQWAAAYFKGGFLTQSEFDGLAAPTAGTTPGAAVGLFNQTEPDPSWTPTVSWDIGTIGRACDDFDLEIARHS